MSKVALLDVNVLVAVYLAGLAHVRGGKLATFDRSIPITSIAGARPGLLEVIAPDEE